MPIERIFLDMDNVLADFDGHVAKLFGLTWPQLEEKWLCHHCPTRFIDQVLKVSTHHFWEIINGSPRFWTNIQSYPDTKRIYAMCVNLVGEENVYIASNCSPDWAIGVYEDKLRWLCTHVWDIPYNGPKWGAFANRLIPIRHKFLLANATSLLIDDIPTNCTFFRKEGGHAITFPALGNEVQNYRTKPLEYLRTFHFFR